MLWRIEGLIPIIDALLRGLVLRFTSLGYRVKAKVVYIADPGLADGSTRVVELGDSLRCCG
jgi:hypothetical protein